ncbi:MAG: hypothetical protein ACE5JS_20925 [Nitrospinota bacterium]
MRVDLYTKVVLTVIALALTVLALQPYILANRADAQNSREIVDVRIRSIEQTVRLPWEPIRVRCENCR